MQIYLDGNLDRLLKFRKKEDPIQILKVRFANGEITREEFEEMRKMLES